MTIRIAALSSARPRLTGGTRCLAIDHIPENDGAHMGAQDDGTSDDQLGFAPDDDAPIGYMARTRDYYAAIGYTRPIAGRIMPTRRSSR